MNELLQYDFVARAVASQGLMTYDEAYSIAVSLGPSDYWAALDTAIQNAIAAVRNISPLLENEQPKFTTPQQISRADVQRKRKGSRR